jgi:hypothetical protein
VAKLNCPKRGRRHNTQLGSQGYHRLPGQGSARAEPSLSGGTGERARDQTKSRPSHTGKCGCTDKPGQVTLDQPTRFSLSNHLASMVIHHE